MVIDSSCQASTKVLYESIIILRLRSHPKAERFDTAAKSAHTSGLCLDGDAAVEGITH